LDPNPDKRIALGCSRSRAVGIVAAVLLVLGPLLGATPPERAAATALRNEDAQGDQTNPIRKLQNTLRGFKGVLGKDDRKDLREIAERAQRQFRAHRYCASAKTLNAFVRRAKRLRKGGQTKARTSLVGRAHRAQEKIVGSFAGQSACGIPAPRFKVDGTIQPAQSSLPPLDDGADRPLARLADDDGSGADFVSNELIVTTDDPAVLAAFLDRWNGTLLSTTDPGDAGSDRPAVHLVRIDTNLADADGLTADIRRLEPLGRGDVLVSSGAGRDLLAAAASEAEDGLIVGVNWVAEPTTHFLDRVVAEAPTSDEDGYTPNPFEWWYMRTGGVDIGVAEAWRDLEIAGRLDNKVTIAIIDGGYAPSADFPSNTTGANGVPANDNECGDGSCPWHGHQVAAAAAAVPANDFGTAGPAGPVANLMFLSNDGGMYDIIDEIYYAFEHDADIINMSFKWETDALFSAALIPFEDATQEAREQGVLVFAGAGNDAMDVDAEDCFIVCWEEEWVAPCENQGVICVGGLATDSTSRHKKSNWGYEWCGKAPCNVDIFGPMKVFLGADPTNPDNEAYIATGTSVSSPFVAGVAALIWAANPELSDYGVELALKQWAHKSSDKQVARYVNALSSVRHTFEDNVAPFVAIDAPKNQTTIPYGGFNSMTFEATTADIEDGDDCCVVSWSSTVDGPLGVGKKVEFVFPDPGQRTITAKAIDSGGASTAVTVDVAATNEPPMMFIEKPISPTDELYRNVPHKLNGEASDLNDPTGLPCSSFVWTSSNSNDSSYTGCHPLMTFTTTGMRTITLTGADAYGATGSDSVAVNVVNPPLNSPPIVTIINPDEDAYLKPDKLVKLHGTAVDPDGDKNLVYKWTVQVGGGVYKVADAATVWWKPSNDVPFNCGGQNVVLRLHATDGDGKIGLDMVSVKVAYPPC
jgi:serine protease